MRDAPRTSAAAAVPASIQARSVMGASMIRVVPGVPGSGKRRAA